MKKEKKTAALSSKKEREAHTLKLSHIADGVGDEIISKLSTYGVSRDGIYIETYALALAWTVVRMIAKEEGYEVQELFDGLTGMFQNNMKNPMMEEVERKHPIIEIAASGANGVVMVEKEELEQALLDEQEAKMVEQRGMEIAVDICGFLEKTANVSHETKEIAFALALATVSFLTTGKSLGNDVEPLFNTCFEHYKQNARQTLDMIDWEMKRM